jgi:hypothetical protein
MEKMDNEFSSIVANLPDSALPAMQINMVAGAVRNPEQRR